MTTTITVMLRVLAVPNTEFLTWAMVADARHASALARAFGATPGQATAALSAAQIAPAALGALLGRPSGDPDSSAMASVAGPPLVLIGAVLAVAVCAAIPAGFGARRPVADVLSAETA